VTRSSIDIGIRELVTGQGIWGGHPVDVDAGVAGCVQQVAQSALKIVQRPCTAVVVARDTADLATRRPVGNEDLLRPVLNAESDTDGTRSNRSAQTLTTGLSTPVTSWRKPVGGPAVNALVEHRPTDIGQAATPNDTHVAVEACIRAPAESIGEWL
jgi:hypothetical protein